MPGRTIVVTTEQGLYARARRRDDALLHLTSTTNDGRRLSQTFDLQDPDGLIEVRDSFSLPYCSRVGYCTASPHQDHRPVLLGPRSTLPSLPYPSHTQA